MGEHTRQGYGACNLLGRSNWGVVVRHAGGGEWWVVGGCWWRVVVDMGDGGARSERGGRN